MLLHCVASKSKNWYQEWGSAQQTLSATNWHFHWHLLPTSPRIKSCAAEAIDFQHPLKGVHGGEQK